VPSGAGPRPLGGIRVAAALSDLRDDSTIESANVEATVGLPDGSSWGADLRFDAAAGAFVTMVETPVDGHYDVTVSAAVETGEFVAHRTADLEFTVGTPSYSTGVYTRTLDGDSGGTSTPSDTGTSEPTGSDGPGFGVGTTVATLAGTAAALRRLPAAEDGESDDAG
jgi:hypothetical protein